MSDPYGCALRIDPKTHVLTVSVYRRPLPATNLSFLSAVMFDGRETVAPLTREATDAANLKTDLTQQATDATTGHAQAAAPPTVAQLPAEELGESAVLARAQQAFQPRRGAGVAPVDGSQIVRPLVLGQLEDSIEMAAHALLAFRFDT